MDIINNLIDKIYDYTFPPSCLQRLHTLIAGAREAICQPRNPHWDEKDVVLITYADQFHEENTPTLTTFSRFWQQHPQG